MLIAWQYRDSDGRFIGVAKRGRNSHPWRIGYRETTNGWSSPLELAQKQFRKQEDAQAFLDDYADTAGWRLHDPKYEDILEQARKTPHLKTLYKTRRRDSNGKRI